MEPAARESRRPVCFPLEPRAIGVSALLDSAALAAKVDSVGWFRRGDHVLLTLRYDSAGAPQDVRILENTVARPHAKQLAVWVRRSMVLLDDADYARLRVTRSEGVRLDLEAVEYCEPVIREQDDVHRVLASFREATGVEGGVLRIDLLIDQHGTVVERSLRQRSGVEMFDDLVLRMLGHMRYEPARFDGLPVAARLTYEVKY